MTATENITSMKLKIRIGSKQIGANPVTKKYEIIQGPVVGNECCRSISMSICNKPEMVKSHKLVIPSSDTLKVKFSSMSSNKRGLSLEENGQKEKKRKMDRIVTQQCAFLLKQLMSHPAGWVFNKPVDPVELQIPDYFYIISQPMDLGTVKIKLNNNEYASVDEFAAHVRLTFSNAMRYNPPGNSVHFMAKELNALFDLEWNALEAKWSGERRNLQQRQNISRVVKCTDILSKNESKNPPSHAKLEKKIPTSVVENMKLREKHLELARISPAREPEQVSQQSRVKITPKGTDNNIGNAAGSANSIPPPNSVTSKCGICRNMSCECDMQNEKSHASIDILSEGSRDSPDVSMRDCVSKLNFDSQLRKSEPESKGSTSAINEKGISSCPPLSTTEVTITSSEGCAPVIDFPLSPQKALRAALLKSRFADTIFKAKQKALLDKGDKADPVKLQQEKERLEREQQDERARIEAQIRASEEAARIRAEAERKMQREQEREAARLVLQQMVKTVEIDNDHKIMKDLELLSCGSCESSSDGASVESGRFIKSLEQLGLFMKDDHMEEEEEDSPTIISGQGDGGEEGEIL